MYKNFTLKETRDLPEMNGTGRMYEHSSGAHILHVQNDDENKVFNVMFRTPPGDDTGVPHILEHCVLNGSEKFPLKDPFFTLVKGSLQTFINAMTYPDITMYPVASYNDKDFLNLMNVYLDAVYKPLIHKRDSSFLQEGWHYVMNSPEDDLTINGVVYSEMKGAYSTPESVLDQVMSRHLFPQSQYRFSSGGDPSAIPDLTYEQFTEFHKTLYSPANSFIYLYGNMEIDPCFDMLDDYLCGAEDRREEVRKAVNVAPQVPLSAPVFCEAEYSINEKDNPAGKNYLGAYYCTSSYPDPTTLFGYSALNYILMSTPASPLRTALLEKKMGETVSGWYSIPMTTPYYALIAQNSHFDVQAFKACVEDVIKGIVANGLDKKFVEACLNKMEFDCREKDYGAPKGLIELLVYGNGWTYGVNPMDYFSPVAAITAIRKKLAAGERYFENLAEKLFLDNNFAGFITLEAKPGLQGAEEEKLKEALAERKAKLTPGEIEKIIGTKAKLEAWQNTPDTPEQLATIPILALSDISKEAKAVSLEERTFGESAALYLNAPTDGIVYNTFMFDVWCLAKEEIPFIGILTALLSKLDTKQRSYVDLTSEVEMQLGGFATWLGLRGNKDGIRFMPTFEVAVKALEKNTSFIYSLTAEIITETLFDDKDRIKMLLAEKKAQMESEFISGGMSYAMRRSKAYISQKEALSDLASGYGFYGFLKDIVDNFDSKFDAFRQSLYSISRKIFNKDALTTAILCNEKSYGDAQGQMPLLYGALADGMPHVSVNLTPAFTNEAFIAETKVNYNAQAFNWRAAGQNPSGRINVLNGIMSNEYLLQELRVKGGAYGYYGNIGYEGLGVFASYRDPNLARTYEVYKNLPAFIENFKPSDREMSQFILGAINHLDSPKTAPQKLYGAIHNYYAGMSLQDLQTERDEILSATATQMREFAPILEKCVNNGPICTFGSESSINENSKLFGRIVKL